MPVHLNTETRQALGGPGLPQCDSRSLWKDKFVFFDAGFDEAKVVALNLFIPAGRRGIASLRDQWTDNKKKQENNRQQQRRVNEYELNKATTALAATQSFGHSAPKPVLRQRRWLSGLAPERTRIFKMRTSSRLLVGLANGVLENAGCTLHPLFGYPIIPASAIKAVARDVAAASGKTKEDIQRLFGGLPGDDENVSQGTIAFLDAQAVLTEGQVDLELDVVTPHFREYYAGAGNTDANDNEAPMPSAFPAVAAGVEFEFVLYAFTSGLTNIEANQALDAVEDCLKHALVSSGVGAKTAAGYGRFVSADAAAQGAIRQDLFPPPPKPVLSIAEEVRANWHDRTIGRMMLGRVIADLQRIEDNDDLAAAFDAILPSTERANFRLVNPYWAEFKAKGGEAILTRINRPLPKQ